MASGVRSAEVLETLADPGRLAAIRAIGLRSPDITAALDDLAALARDVLDVPVALATLVEPEGQTFVGLSGLEEPWASSRRTPLSHSFCQYVVAEDQPLVVANAAEHPTLRDSPAVTDLQVRAYVGYPLRDQTGVVLGSFCVLDTEPREWTDAELRRLETFGGIATRQVAAHIRSQELALTAQQNSELIDSALEAIVSVDVEGRIVGWNRHAVELFGWSFDEVRGKFVEDVIVPERLAIHHAAGFRKAAAGGFPTLTRQRIRVPGLHRDGRELLLELSLTASVQGPDGPRFHAFMHDVSADVTAADPLRSERAFLRALLDSLETGVVASDPDGRPKVINRALRRIHRLPPHGPIPDDWLAATDLRHADGSPMSPDEMPLARACRGEHVRDVETIVYQDGEEPRSFLAHGEPIIDEGGRMLGAVLAVHDITDLKRHEQERDELLLREQAQVEELRRLYDQRKQFVAVVSHELRSPLSTILGFSQLLLEGRDSLTDTQQKMLTIIENGAHRMLGIVSDLLVLEEVDRDGARFEHRRVDLAPVAHDAVEAMLPTARASSVTITVRASGPTVVIGDEQRLRQVLDNLVSNAVKYSPGGGEVTVVVAGDEREGTTLTVTDTGIGIPEDERHRLFERFFRTSTARNTGVPGTGLGLTVVRTIVERHGGRITADPGPEGVGTVFTVWLPPPGSVTVPED